MANEIMNNVDLLIMSLDCLSHDIEGLDDEKDYDKALNYFADCVINNELVLSLKEYVYEHDEPLVKQAIANLVLLVNTELLMNDMTDEDKEKVLSMIEMSIMMSRTYLRLFKRISSGKWN